MHPFFALIDRALRPLPPEAREGTVEFRVAGQALRYHLGHAQSLRSERAEPDLIVWTSLSQLDDMMRSGRSTTPLRIEGDEALLGSLAMLLAPPKSVLASRAGGR